MNQAVRDSELPNRSRGAVHRQRLSLLLSFQDDKELSVDEPYSGLHTRRWTLDCTHSTLSSPKEQNGTPCLLLAHLFDQKGQQRDQVMVAQQEGEQEEEEEE